MGRGQQGTKLAWACALLVLFCLWAILLSRPGSQRRILRSAVDRVIDASIAQDEYDKALQTAKSFTYQWKRQPATRNVLMFTRFEDYAHRMSRFYYHLVDSALEHPDANVTVWGPGFPGYVNAMSPGENINSSFGCRFFDFMYYHAGNVYFKDRKELAPCYGQLVVVEELEDCFDYKCQETSDKVSDIILTLYAFQVLELFNMSSSTRPPRLFAHAPHCVDPRIIQPGPFERKTTAATLFGAVYSEKYPLRTTMVNGIHNKTIKSVEIYSHPGYDLGSSDPAPEQYKTESPRTLPQRRQYANYAAALKSSRLCLFDSSIIRKAIRKYMEAMMAGCVVAADMPLEMEEVLGPAMLVLAPNESAEGIDAKLAATLANPALLRQLAGRGIQAALQHFTCYRKFELILQYVDEFKRGYRGYIFPHGFRLGCHNYGAYNGYKNPNKWCTQKS